MDEESRDALKGVVTAAVHAADGLSLVDLADAIRDGIAKGATSTANADSDCDLLADLLRGE